MLHKETLKETYDLESILQQYEEEAKNRKKKSKEEKIREESKREKDRIEMEENQNIEVQENSYYSKSRENYAVMEEDMVRSRNLQNDLSLENGENGKI